MFTELLATMPLIVLLLLSSAFFSGSEAAFFSLTLAQRRGLERSSRLHARMASSLLNHSERTLMGILFWNLVINISYFSLISRLGLALSPEHPDHSARVVLLAVGGLVAIILLGEFLPKSMGVLYPLGIVRWTAFPLSFAVRAISVIMPVLEFITEFSRRLLWPSLRTEPYLSTEDLNRAIELSSGADSLIETEALVLQNIIQLREIRAEEWMRPRTQHRTFSWPIDWEQLGSQMTPSGYMLIADPLGNHVVAYIDLRNLSPRELSHFESHRKSVVIVPWCTGIADTLQRLCRADRRVALVVNEYGDSIGILTWEDIFDAILQLQAGRSYRELARAEIRKMGEDRWLATGMTKLRRLERAIGKKIDDAESLTLAGIVQQQLRRLPEAGDTCQVGQLRLSVLEAGDRGELLIEVTIIPESESVA
jgi:putative hemolysin